MSVYIKGMEMPKRDDEYVIFTVYGDGGVVYGPLNRPHVRYKNRAFPVPDHGRLVDADALMRGLEPTEDERHNGAALVLAVFSQVLKNAPTIITADKEDGK